MTDGILFDCIDRSVRQFLYRTAGRQLCTRDTRLNAEGDRYIVAGPHGPDISLQRPDRLDRCCAFWVMHRENAAVLDIGCGIGAQTLRLAALGAAVVAIDKIDQDQQRMIDGYFSGAVHSARFLHADIRDLVRQLPPAGDLNKDIIYSQRMWSSIPYADGLEILRYFSDRGAEGSPPVFFMSSVGLHSEIGEYYPHRHKPVEQRFSPYDAAMARKHGVTAPECLFTQDEFAQQFAEAGLEVVESWQSAFGNPKIVAVHPRLDVEGRTQLKAILHENPQ